MSNTFEAILEAARRLPVEQQRRLAEQLLTPGEGVGTLEHTPARGGARRHFGAWDSGDERSADNERIDLDLAQAYGDPGRL